jgi:4-carboxymuconolactone decarboxylase
MQRPPELNVDALTPEQRKVYDAIMSGPRGHVVGPLRVWLQSAELADRAQALGAFCRFGSSLPPRLSELAIIVIGAYWKAGFEFWAHGPMAIKAGIDAAAVEAIRNGETPNLIKADEQAVFEFARELVHDRRVSDATYERAVKELGLKSVVDLTGILGYYGLICMTIRAFHVPVPPGQNEPFGA